MALRISIPMPPRLTHYVLCAAIESSCGSGYWLRDYATRCQFTKEPSVGATDDYCTLHVGQPNKGAECDEPPKHSRVGASRIARALELMLASGNDYHAKTAGAVIGGDFDATDADIVLQYAVFGETIYG